MSQEEQETGPSVPEAEGSGGISRRKALLTLGLAGLAAYTAPTLLGLSDEAEARSRRRRWTSRHRRHYRRRRYTRTSRHYRHRRWYPYRGYHRYHRRPGFHLYIR